ncbi:hypothetical protein KAI87_17810, partial [Myxococcota bacterium]|nr:hypothetical protein [Myxococcota bacterium]
MKSFLLNGILASLFVVIGLSGVANAQTITTQLRWEPSSALAPTDMAILDESGGMYPSDLETGLAIGVQLGNMIVRGNLSMDRVGFTNKSETSGEAREITRTTTFTFITPSVSGQFYFMPPTAGTLVPFVSGRLGKTLTFIGTSRECTGVDCTAGDTSNPDAEDEAWEEQAEDTVSPWLISVGGGGDYFINDNISLGMETGMRFTYGGGTYEMNGDYEKESISMFNLLYGVVTLNF